MEVSVRINAPQTIIEQRGLQPGGRTQMVFANEVLTKSIKRTPKQEGYLIMSGRIVNQATALIYTMPYARYVWYGNVMKGKAPKYTTNKPLTYQESPIRGKKWVLRTMQEEKTEILQLIAQEAGVRTEW